MSLRKILKKLQKVVLHFPESAANMWDSTVNMRKAQQLSKSMPHNCGKYKSYKVIDISYGVT